MNHAVVPSVFAFVGLGLADGGLEDGGARPCGVYFCRGWQR